MDIVSKLLRLAGKDNFTIDKSIPISYILRLCWKYGWMMMRGTVSSFGSKGISGGIFIGKGVSLIEKQQMHIGAKTKIHDNVLINALSTNGVKIGEYCVLGDGCRLECTGGLKKIGKGIIIGNRTTFSNDCYFGGAGGIEIGEDVVGGQYIRFHSENHNYEDLSILIRDQGVTNKGIRIGNNCWIGSGAIFLDGAELGDGCVVAANAVVTKKFDDNSVIGGIPAKLLKKRGNGRLKFS